MCAPIGGEARSIAVGVAESSTTGATTRLRAGDVVLDFAHVAGGDDLRVVGEFLGELDGGDRDARGAEGVHPLGAAALGDAGGHVGHARVAVGDARRVRGVVVRVVGRGRP